MQVEENLMLQPWDEASILVHAIVVTWTVSPPDCYQCCSESKYKPTSLSLTFPSCHSAQCCLFEASLKKQKKKRPWREAELFASNFTPTEIFTRMPSLWRHERSVSTAACVQPVSRPSGEERNPSTSLTSLPRRGNWFLAETDVQSQTLPFDTEPVSCC